MSRFVATSLHTVIMLLVLLALLPPLCLSLYANIEQRRQGGIDLQTDAVRFARFAAARQEQLIEEGRQVLLSLVRMLEVHNLDAVSYPVFVTHLRDLCQRFAVFGVADADGLVRCFSADVAQPASIADLPWFKRAVLSGGFTVGSYEEGGLISKPVFFLAYPMVEADGHVKGVVFAGIDLADVNSCTEDLELPEWGAFVMMIDGAGTILTRCPDHELWVGKSLSEAAVVAAVLEKREGIIYERGADGVDRLFAFSPVHGVVDTGLFMAISVPARESQAKARFILVRNLTGLTITAVLSLIAAWSVGKLFILKRVTDLLETTRRLASGDLNARCGLQGSRNELGRLALAFDEMAESLQQRTRELGSAEARYRGLVERIPVVTYIVSLDESGGTVTFVSPQIETMLGYSVEEWLAEPRMWHKRLHPEGREEVMTEVQTVFNNPRIGTLRYEYRILARDGRVVWVNDEAEIERDEEGVPRLLRGVMLDITERRNAEEKLLNYQQELRSLASQLSLAEERERRRIATDVHDLIGQKLAVSKIKLELAQQSVADLAIAPLLGEIKELMEQAIEDSRSLIFKISSPILYEFGFEAALEWLAEEFQRQHGITCLREFEEDPEPLDHDVRVLLYQAVNELLANVIKHAHAKTVRISVRREGGYICIAVEDDGAGVAVSKMGTHQSKAGGFGLFSIRERLNPLGGRLDVDSKPGRGTRVTLRVPLKNDSVVIKETNL